MVSGHLGLLWDLLLVEGPVGAGRRSTWAGATGDGRGAKCEQHPPLRSFLLAQRYLGGDSGSCARRHRSPWSTLACRRSSRRLSRDAAFLGAAPLPERLTIQPLPPVPLRVRSSSRNRPHAPPPTKSSRSRRRSAFNPLSTHARKNDFAIPLWAEGGHVRRVRPRGDAEVFGVLKRMVRAFSPLPVGRSAHARSGRYCG